MIYKEWVALALERLPVGTEEAAWRLQLEER
jgi:hypothetical protein